MRTPRHLEEAPGTYQTVDGLRGAHALLWVETATIVTGTARPPPRHTCNRLKRKYPDTWESPARPGPISCRIRL